MAIVIANSQANDRDDISERFTRRPAISAALTSALFSATTTTPKQQERLTELYGGKSVSNATLTHAAKRSNDVFIALLDAQGEMMAVSAGAPPGVKAELASDPEYVQAVRDGQPAGGALRLSGPRARAATPPRPSCSRSSPPPGPGCW